MSEECVFTVFIHSFKATELTTRNRFKDKLKIEGDFDEKKFKSKKELIGGGDVSWKKFSFVFEYKIFSWTLLEQRELKIKLMLSKTECYGSVAVDLYTIATGVVEHDLPIIDFASKTVGRLNFHVKMNQICNIAVCFKEIQLRNLKPVGKGECNPYLKYAYSKDWPDVVEGIVKATYSSVQHNNVEPYWNDLPPLRFFASLQELLSESIVLHVTHHGLITNTTLGRCNLLFKTLVDNGKTFRDDDLISFKGPLKIENAEIEGQLTFKFLPRFAQMKPISTTKKAIHTEKGIYDAVPFIFGLPKPNCPIILSQDSNPLMKSEETVGRARSATAAPKLLESYNEEKTKRANEDIKEPEPSKHRGSYEKSQSLDPSRFFPHAEDTAPSPRARRTLQMPEKTTIQKDLISFSPIPTRKIKSAVNVKDPFLDLLSPSNSSVAPTFNPFEEPTPKATGTNPFVI